MNSPTKKLLGTLICTFLILCGADDISAQFEVYPSFNNWSNLDLKVQNTKTVEINANSSFLFGRGSDISLFRYDDNLDRDRTVSIRAASNDNNAAGNYGAITLDAYVETTQFFANNGDLLDPPVGVPSSSPFAMLSLVKHVNKNQGSAVDYSWNIGVYDEFEFDFNIDFADQFDCQDCLTFAFQDGAGAAFYKYSFGSDADFQTASDARLKENIADVGSSLNRLMELSPKKYHYIWSDKNPDRKSSGFLAQDVQKVFPDLVSSIRQPNGERTLMMNYIGLIPHITKGLQEQQDIIDEQANEISNQEDQIAKLITIIEKLQTRVDALEN